MPKRLWYVGKKQEETAFQDRTGGIVWTPGKSAVIEDDALANRMLMHPDVFSDKEPGETADSLELGQPDDYSIDASGAPPQASVSLCDAVLATELPEGVQVSAIIAPGVEVAAPAPAPAPAAKTGKKRS
jgi:hypothetical protein